jgi:hypothetical protein
MTVACYSDWTFLLVGDGYVNFTIDANLDFNLLFNGVERFPESVSVSDISSKFLFDNFQVHAKHKLENWFLNKLKTLITKEISKVLEKKNDEAVKSLVSDLSQNVAALYSYLSEPIPRILVPYFYGDEYLNLDANFPIVKFLDFFLNNVLGVDGPLNLNFLVQQLTRNSSALQIGSKNATLIFNHTIASFVQIDFEFLGGEINGLSSFNLFEMFVPTSSNYFESRLGMNELNFKNVSFASYFRLNETSSSDIQDSHSLEENTFLELSLEQLLFNFSNVLLVDKGAVHLQGDQYVDFGCIREAIANFSLSEIQSNNNIKKFEVLSNQLLNNDFNNIFNDFFLNLNTRYPVFFPTIVSRVLQYPVLDQLNRIFAESFADSNSSCVLYNERTEGLWSPYFLSLPATVIAVSVSTALSVVVIILAVVFNKNPKYAKSPILFLNRKNGMGMRCLIPIIAIYCTGFFLVVVVGNTGFTALILKFDNVTVIPPTMFVFDLPNLITDAYHANAWANVLGLTVLGICWILGRQLLILFVFFVPFKKQSKLRKYTIWMIDVLGKWIGFFFIEAMLIPMAFRLHVSPFEEVEIDLITTGSLPYYMYIVALLFSMFGGNLLVDAFRTFNFRPKNNLEFDENNRKSFLKRSMILNGKKMRLKPVSIILIVFCILLLSVLTFCSVYLYSFSFSLGGLAGALLPKINTTETRSFSLLTTVFDYHEISFVNAWMYFMQTVLFTTCVLMPFVLLFFYLVLIAIPFKRKVQNSLINIVQICQSWNFLEVFFGSILCAMLSMSLIARFMLGDQCSMINDVIAEYFTGYLEGDYVCYDVITRPLIGFWFMLATWIVGFTFGQLFLVLARYLINETFSDQPSSYDDYDLDLKKSEKGDPKWIAWLCNEDDPEGFATSLLN